MSLRTRVMIPGREAPCRRPRSEWSGHHRTCTSTTTFDPSQWPDQNPWRSAACQWEPATLSPAAATTPRHQRQAHSYATLSHYHRLQHKSSTNTFISNWTLSPDVLQRRLKRTFSAGLWSRLTILKSRLQFVFWNLDKHLGLISHTLCCYSDLTVSRISLFSSITVGMFTTRYFCNMSK